MNAVLKEERNELETNRKRKIVERWKISCSLYIKTQAMLEERG
jgi:hypothetical protein